jgi:hypothetical protein
LTEANRAAIVTLQRTQAMWLGGVMVLQVAVGIAVVFIK